MSKSDIDILVEKWCDRRAYTFLRKVLEAYPHFGHTDQIAELYDNLRYIERVMGRDLPPDELELLSGILDASQK
jgi:hypothetical protein